MPNTADNCERSIVITQSVATACESQNQYHAVSQNVSKHMT